MKSREALALLTENHSDVEIIEYLKETPDANELKSIIDKLGIPAAKLIRTKEEIFKPYRTVQLSEAEAIDLMVKHPVLIERPIVAINGRWVIARPIEKLQELI
jgi:arsenate reductase